MSKEPKDHNAVEKYVYDCVSILVILQLVCIIGIIILVFFLWIKCQESKPTKGYPTNDMHVIQLLIEICQIFLN